MSATMPLSLWLPSVENGSPNRLGTMVAADGLASWKSIGYEEIHFDDGAGITSAGAAVVNNVL
jgi:hypothetical protein